MRVAVCLSGEMRGRDDCLKFLHERVVEPFQSAGSVDLFVHTRCDKWWRPACDLPFRSLQVEHNHERDISDILSDTNPLHLGKGGGGRRGFLWQSYMQQFWSLQAVGEMKRRAERQDGESYDWVVRCRPDCYLLEPLNVASLVSGSVNLPDNDWWPGEDSDGNRLPSFCDKFAVGPSQGMDAYLDPFLHLRRFCRMHELRGETYVGWRLREFGVKHNRLEGLKVAQAEDPYRYSEKP